MSIPGTKPAPTADKELRGNPGKRPLNDSEPKPSPLFQLPEPPEHIGEYGGREWLRVGPVLIQNGLLTEADVQVFEAYCLNVEMLIQARLDIKKNGMTIRSDRGGRARNPSVTAFTAATTAIRSLAAEFGMTPSSRSRIRLPSDDGDVLGQLMGDANGEEDFTQGV